MIFQLARLDHRRAGASPRRTRTRAGVLLIGVLMAVSACSPAKTLLGISPLGTSPSTAPVVTAEQAVEVSVRALGQAQLADTKRTQTAAEMAFTGLALETAGPEYVVAKALAASSPAPGQALAPISNPSRIIVTAGVAFPRIILAVWTPTGSAIPQLVVLSSATVSTPYRVSARTNLIPGSAMPQTLPNASGAPLVPQDATDLVATPSQALADLAIMLETGDAKKSKTKFASSKVMSDVRANAQAQAKDVDDVASFKQDHGIRKSPVIAVRTADGGAIVVAALTRNDVFDVRDEAGSITPPAAYKALAPGVDKITGKATVTTVETVAIAIPPKGGESVQLIGFSEIPVAVKAS